MDNELKVASFFSGNGSKVTPLLHKSNLPTAGYLSYKRKDCFLCWSNDPGQ
jgi:hypothetical protein